MTALAANTALELRNTHTMRRRSFVILTAKKIYRHAMVELTAAGKAQPCSNATTTTFAGIAEEEVASGDGTLRVTVLDNMEAYFNGTGAAVTALTAGMVGDTKIYAVDDQQVTNATTLGPAVGYITERVAANQVWVLLGSTGTRANAA